MPAVAAASTCHGARPAASSSVGQPGVEGGQRGPVGVPQRGDHRRVEAGGAPVEVAGGALGVGGGAVPEHQ